MQTVPVVHWTTDERLQEERTHWSNFWIMINSNQAGTDLFDRGGLVTLMRNAVDRVFASRTNLSKVLKIMDANGAEETDPVKIRAGLAKIERVESEAVVEVGPKVHRVHAHVLLLVQHKCRVHLDVQALRDSIREASKVDGVTPRFPNPAVRVKLIRENPLNAIRKYQRGYKNKIPLTLIEQVQSTHPETRINS